MRNGASSPLPRIFSHLACLVDGSLIPVAHLDGEPKDTLNKDTTAKLCNIVNDITGCSLFGSNKACAATIVATTSQSHVRFVTSVMLLIPHLL